MCDLKSNVSLLFNKKDKIIQYLKILAYHVPDQSTIFFHNNRWDKMFYIIKLLKQHLRINIVSWMICPAVVSATDQAAHTVCIRVTIPTP